MSDDDLRIEKKWLQRARLDLEDFDRFYDKYFDRVSKFILIQTRDLDVAMDLTQETFLKAMADLEKFHWQGYTFGAWLYRIATNRIRDHKRRTEREQPLDPLFEADLRAIGKSALVDLIDLEDRRFLRECLGRLDDLEQEIFSLKHDARLKVREIAVVLDLPEGTIRSRLKRGREKIRRMFHARDEIERKRG